MRGASFRRGQPVIRALNAYDHSNHHARWRLGAPSRPASRWSAATRRTAPRPVFAEGSTRAAPQALQVADRYHLRYKPGPVFDPANPLAEPPDG